MGAKPRVCFLLLVHKAPDQVARLVEALSPYPVLVHVDARADEGVWADFGKLAARHGTVTLTARARSGWASWGLVEAMLNGTEMSLDLGFSHLVKMTGQDYPLRPVEQIAEFFGANPGVSFVPHNKIPVAFIGDKDGGVSRVKNWHLPMGTRRVSIPMNRRPPERVAPFYGAAEFVISIPLAQWLLEQVRRRPELVRFFRRTWAPDELFVPSLAMSSPMAGDVSPANLWFTDWTAGGPHPRVFLRQDIDRLRTVALGQAGALPGGEVKLFARKFDLARDGLVLDLSDQQLLHRQVTRTS
jgi:Core-2/I-Branching enzyme